MLQLIKIALQQFVYDIDAGNSIITEEDQNDIIELIQKINQKELSKIESANYIGVCRATFDNYVKKGLIPKGQKKQGHPLLWNKSDLDKFKQNKK